MCLPPPPPETYSHMRMRLSQTTTTTPTTTTTTRMKMELAPSTPSLDLLCLQTSQTTRSTRQSYQISAILKSPLEPFSLIFLSGISHNLLRQHELASYGNLLQRSLFVPPPEKKRKKEKNLSFLFYEVDLDRLRHRTGPFFLLGPVLQGFLHHYLARKAMRILVRGETSFGSEVERQQ